MVCIFGWLLPHLFCFILKDQATFFFYLTQNGHDSHRYCRERDCGETSKKILVNKKKTLSLLKKLKRSLAALANQDVRNPNGHDPCD